MCRRLWVCCSPTAPPQRCHPRCILPPTREMATTSTQSCRLMTERPSATCVSQSCNCFRCPDSSSQSPSNLYIPTLWQECRAHNSLGHCRNSHIPTASWECSARFSRPYNTPPVFRETRNPWAALSPCPQNAPHSPWACLYLLYNNPLMTRFFLMQIYKQYSNYYI